MRRGGIRCSALLLMLVGCRSFGEADPPPAPDGAADAAPDAGGDAGDGAAPRYEVPCPTTRCRDLQFCCASACANSCSQLNDNIACNDAQDCAARGDPGAVCCGRLIGANMEATRCAKSCYGAEVEVCDPFVTSGGCRIAAQQCQPRPYLNQGGFGVCK